ncbi:response regulator [Marinobacterium jannaschii]|uniref:response regulator n=1 Tax=Marinobacterium jannaschii TaxID=64970 RepID=UPI000683F34A|nr:response regulator [Marinobacterium jannaschii]
MDYDYSHFSVLHGEDDVADTRMMEVVLDKMGFNGSYENLYLGQDVMARMNDPALAVPDLLILDIGLPGMNGKEILAGLRQNERTLAVPVLMLSGSSSLRDYQECVRLGANGYIKKSSDFVQFSLTCEHFIEGWARLSNQSFF